MKRTALHIVALLLAGIIFYTSTGVSVHKMYCYCKEEFAASLFCIDDNCADEFPEGESCCSDGICGTTSDGNHNCSDCETEKALFDADYLIFTPKLEVHQPVFLVCHSPLLKSYLPLVQVSFVSYDHLIAFAPSGRQLLPWLQSFLC